MQILNDVKLDFDDVLIRPKRSENSSRRDVHLKREFKTRNSSKHIKGIPIIAANMDAVGTFEMAKALSVYNMFTCLHKFYSPEKLTQFFSEESAAKHTFYTLGIKDDDIHKLALVRDKMKDGIGPKKICVDVANGYTDFFCKKVSEIRNMFKTAVIMAGNVCTADMVQELIISARADIIKIGIGPGSVCKTRKITGIGYPQLSSIIECADAAHGMGGLVCADGGCREVGDIAKAFGAGADFVMLGGMFAGTNECEGEWEFAGHEKTHIKFYGMSSKEAMDKHSGGMSNYKASEGECIRVPYKGEVYEVIKEMLGGIRSTCAYVGAKTLKDLSKCTTFVRKR